MSRRIAIATAVTIGVIVLASPTYADRECFGGTCPDIEPPAELTAPPASTAATPTAPALPRVIEPQAAAPAATIAPAIEAPALRPAPPAALASPKPAIAPAPAPSQRFAIDEERQLSRPIRSTSRYIEQLPPEQPRAVTAEVAPAYVVQQAPAYGTPPSANIVIVGAPTMYGDDGVLPAHPNMYPDPAWKLCQVDRSPHDRRYYHCGPYSYHPYGSNGYRPLGTYRAYRAAPAYVYAPSARIIQVENFD
jgi:hypothetical protein